MLRWCIPAEYIRSNCCYALSSGSWPVGWFKSQTFVRCITGCMSVSLPAVFAACHATGPSRSLLSYCRLVCITECCIYLHNRCWATLLYGIGCDGQHPSASAVSGLSLRAPCAVHYIMCRYPFPCLQPLHACGVINLCCFPWVETWKQVKCQQSFVHSCRAIS